jgi:hypothetical protein
MADHALARRLGEFRQMAADAHKHAASATSTELKVSYEELARSWDQLVREIEEAMASGTIPVIRLQP